MINPFPGLRSFQMDEEYLFFGRETHIDELLKRLRNHRFLAILGSSGCGKSSLIRSGLVPALFLGGMAHAGSRWRIMIMRPGGNPIGNMAAKLLHPEVLGPVPEDMVHRKKVMYEATLLRGSRGLVEIVEHAQIDERFLIVVDQFEELFRFHRKNQEEALAFTRLLTEAVHVEHPQIYVVITMRSDYLHNCAELHGLAEAVNAGAYLVPRLTRKQLEATITGPVKVAGGEITPRLVIRLLNDMEDNSDQLPLLQHALMRTWDYWAESSPTESPLDLEHYQAVGTMNHALRRHANKTFEELPDKRSQVVAKRVLEALTVLEKDGRWVRRPNTVAAIADFAGASVAEVKQVAECFRKPGRCFLMPGVDVELDRDTVLDISHESLMRIWKELREWVLEEAESAGMFNRIADATELYEAGEAGTWRDPELGLALEWKKRRHPTPEWAAWYRPGFDSVMQFLEDSCREKEKEERETVLMRRRVRLRTIAFVTLPLVVAVILVFTLILALTTKTYEQNSKANERKAMAIYQDNLKLNGEVKSLKSTLKGEQQKWIIEKDKLQKDFWKEQREIFKKTEDQAAVIEKVEKELKKTKNQLARTERDLGFALDKNTALKTNLDQLTDERDNLRTVEDKTQPYTVTPEESEALTLRERLQVDVGLELAASVPSDRSGNRYRPGMTALAAWQLGRKDNDPNTHFALRRALRFALEKLAPRQAVQTFTGHNAPVSALALTEIETIQENGQLNGKLVSGDLEGSVRILNLARNSGGQSLKRGNQKINALAFSHYGSRLAVGSNRDLQLWSLEQLNIPIRSISYRRGITALQFDEDGNTLFSAGPDVVSRWQFELQQSNPEAWKSETQGSRLLGLTRDDELMIADINGRQARVQVISKPDIPPVDITLDQTITRATLDAVEGKLLTGLADGRILVWDLTNTRRPETIIQGNGNPVEAMVLHSAERLFAAADGNGSNRLFLMTNDDVEPITLASHQGPVLALALSPDGNFLISGGDDRKVHLQPIGPDTLAILLRGHVKRNHTLKEWRSLVGGKVAYRKICPDLPTPIP
ncbi:MAG: hypothetical protein QNK37_29085 [Acidobacteriota bacterium]|nr:hypothetical protein [Acidobacteriota bacterium]